MGTEEMGEGLGLPRPRGLRDPELFTVGTGTQHRPGFPPGHFRELPTVNFFFFLEKIK